MVEEDLEKGSEGWEICLGSSHPGPPLLKDLLGKHEIKFSLICNGS